MHSSELGQESLKELNLNRVTRNSAIGQPLVDRRSVPSERTSDSEDESCRMQPDRRRENGDRIRRAHIRILECRD